jgi:hypothetical protein
MEKELKNPCSGICLMLDIANSSALKRSKPPRVWVARLVREFIRAYRAVGLGDPLPDHYKVIGDEFMSWFRDGSNGFFRALPFFLTLFDLCAALDEDKLLSSVRTEEIN